MALSTYELAAGERWAIPAVVVDWFGRPAKIPSRMPKRAEEKEGRWLYQMEPEFHACQSGLVTPRSTINPGAAQCQVLVTNWRQDDVKIVQGTTLLRVDDEPTLITEDVKADQLSPRMVGLIQEHLDIERYLHATDVPSDEWEGRDVLMNQSLDFGSIESQEKMCAWLDIKKVAEVVVLQFIEEGEEKLQPWKDAGYTVEKIATHAQVRKAYKTKRRAKLRTKWWTKKPELWMMRRKPSQSYVWKYEEPKSVEASDDSPERVVSVEEGTTIKCSLNRIYDPNKWDKRVIELQQMMRDRISRRDGELKEEQVEEIVEALTPFCDIFDPLHIGRSNVVKAEINTGEASPVTAQPYRISPLERDVIRQEVGKMLKLGVIRPSKSPWAALPVLVDKPDGSKRFCVDYRGLNAVTKAEAFPLPRIDDALTALQGCQFFTQMDANCGFWQMIMKDEDCEKTAFVTPDGQFEYVTLPFGLKNAAAQYQGTGQVLQKKGPP